MALARFDTGFKAALNRGRKDVREAAEIRVWMLADSAISVVEQAIRDGDVRAALTVLRGVGLLGGDPAAIGPDDPGILAHLARVEAAEQAHAAMLADLGLSGF